jgi:hypothetical protein
VVFDALVKLKYKYAIELLENGCIDLSSVGIKYLYFFNLDVGGQD